ncbi:MAG: hypothetical protein BGO76_00240 [Caedibacter sp. 38-128]|nr:hypothetical protein [Holosporales bacterium]OJX05014.1 MAG: hypothetical protein BGO76_00240 [Caedibacter sp. 38-128]
MKKPAIIPKKILKNTQDARDLLKSAPSSEFTRILLQNFDVPLEEYIPRLFSYIPTRPMENELRQAFMQEFSNLHLTQTTSTVAADMLEQTRTLQTAAHTTFTNGPGFLGANWLTTLGIPNDKPCIIATFSGIPFDNDAKPGCLNYGKTYQINDFLDKSYPDISELINAEAERARCTADRRVSLIPGRWQRVSVFGSHVHEKTSRMINYLTPQINQFLPAKILQQDFSALALSFSANLETKIFNRKMIFVDLCSIVSNYLQLIFEKDEHPITKFCFEGTNFERFESLHGKIPLFSQSGIEEKSFSQFFREGDILAKRNGTISWNKSTIKNHLKNRELCPGLFLTFLSLTFINQFQCLGGFNQVKYLSKFRNVLSTIDLFKIYDIETIPTDSLIAGRMIDEEGREVYPLDIILGSEVNLNPSRSLGQFATSLILRKRWLK